MFPLLAVGEGCDERGRALGSARLIIVWHAQRAGRGEVRICGRCDGNTSSILGS